MTIQRAVVKGTIASVVQTRSMFTCEVVESGGDTYDILWDAYLQDLYSHIDNLISTVCAVTDYELQNYSAGHWVPFLVVDFPKAGTISGEQIANAVALVLIGKAAGLRHMGRKFISALAESGVSGNTIISALLPEAVLALTSYVTPFTGIGGGTLTPGVVDKVGTFHAFVGGVVSSILGSIRRRKPGLGI